jgi:hypothetical protein
MSFRRKLCNIIMEVAVDYSIIYNTMKQDVRHRKNPDLLGMFALLRALSLAIHEDSCCLVLIHNGVNRVETDQSSNDFSDVMPEQGWLLSHVAFFAVAFILYCLFALSKNLSANQPIIQYAELFFALAQRRYLKAKNRSWLRLFAKEKRFEDN